MHSARCLNRSQMFGYNQRQAQAGTPNLNFELTPTINVEDTHMKISKWSDKIESKSCQNFVKKEENTNFF